MKPLVLSFSTSRYPNSTFGQYIRKARLEKGLKQKDVAGMIGVHEMTIVSWERSTTVPSRTKKVHSLCDLLELDYGCLVDQFLSVSGEQSDLGRTLRVARVRRGLTQEEAASQAGIDPSTLRRWERCSDMPPSWMKERFFRLCQVLGVMESWLPAI